MVHAPHGLIKFNMDATIFSETNTTGFGRCIRNDEGAFVLAQTEWITSFYPIQEGEAMRLLLDLGWIRGLGLSCVLFELDYKVECS